MKRIISERFVTYAANEKWPSTARITIKMCDAIDLAVMQDALAATQQRYPYFCVRFRITNGDDGREYFALEDNPQPWVMQQTSKPVCLMGRESNDHLLAFACWDDSFAIDFFHGLADFYGFKERMDQLEMLPTIAARRQAMAALGDMADIMGTCGLSYVGKANFGAAERYVREMFAEVSSPFELLFEVSAISGKFDITVLYHFATDAYLDAFIDEARQIGLSATIVSRRPLQIAPIAAFYTTD